MSRILTRSIVQQGSNLNQNESVDDAMMFEDEDVYMSSEDENEVYLQLTEEEI